MPNETTTEDETVTEPVTCPSCGARYSYRDLVFGHAHQAGSRFGEGGADQR